MSQSVGASAARVPRGPSHRFRVVAAATVPMCVLFALTLSPLLDSAPARQTASSLGLVLSGIFLLVSSSVRVRVADGRRDSWRLIRVAALVAILGNVWAAAVGSDPVDAPSTVSDATIVVALLLCIAGVLRFPSVRRRGIDQIVLALDGLVIGGAVLIIATALVYDSIVDHAAQERTSALTLLIPVLDIVLIVAALLLLLRTRGDDRGALILLALGFLCYGLSDLSFAVLVSEGTFAFGSYVDLGWIVGYVLLGLAAWYPTTTPEPVIDRPTTAGGSPGTKVGDGSGVRDTIAVYAGLLLALLVQATMGSERGSVLSTALWVTVVTAAVARQVVVTYDNSALRRGLEERVRDQTADLTRMARENETLLSSVADGIYGVDARGVLTFVNPSGADALRYRPEQLLGRPAHETFHAPGTDDVPHAYAGCYVAEAIRSGVVTTAEEDVYVRADGTRFAVEITASPLLDGDFVRGAVVAFRDITQRREVDRMKDEFISVVSHELRTPLTSIRGSLGLLTSGKLGELEPRAQSMATLALTSSERLTRLINDILDLERIKSGARPMEVHPVEGFELLTRALAEMGQMAHTHGVHLELAASGGRVLADPDRVIQTLTNLINNAIKFSTPGHGVELGTVVEGDEVFFRVRDHGRGIPADMLESVFDRFEQVDSSDARDMGGTGLGLAISRSIVERHGGRIWAESDGDGTTVSFSLPRAHDTTPAEQAVEQSAAQRAVSARRVLIVEDDDDLAAVLTTLLVGHAVAVTRASGVSEALAATAGIDFDLVILDVVLTDGDGYQLVDVLRADRRTAAVDLVVYSADDVHPRDRPRLKLGRTLFVTKGRLDPSGVEERVLSMLQSRPDHRRDHP